MHWSLMYVRMFSCDPDYEYILIMEQYCKIRASKAAMLRCNTMPSNFSPTSPLPVLHKILFLCFHTRKRSHLHETWIYSDKNKNTHLYGNMETLKREKKTWLESSTTPPGLRHRDKTSGKGGTPYPGHFQFGLSLSYYDWAWSTRTRCQPLFWKHIISLKEC